MFFTPARHLAAGQALAGIVDGLSAGIEAALAETGVECMLIADMDRAFGPAAGRDLVEQLANLRRIGRAERVIGVGMDSTELGVDLTTFVEPFELARRHGFHRTGHAGEATGVGPHNILVGLDVLGLERIDHGIAVMEDPALARRMAADRIPLTVCPNSNVVIANRFGSLSEHPFKAMRGAGLLATLNTDDPAMTDLDLGKEYRTVAEAQGLDFDDLAAIALDGIEASWLDDADQRELRAGFVQALADLRPRSGADAPEPGAS
jgi:adenosine deaminase